MGKTCSKTTKKIPQKFRWNESIFRFNQIGGGGYPLRWFSVGVAPCLLFVFRTSAYMYKQT